MLTNNKDISVYIHWPFCVKKCPYCDFNSHVSKSKIKNDEWEKSFKSEITMEQNLLGPRKIKSIFFGGGTPSLMPTYLIESILNQLAKKWVFSKNIEITIEANPSSVEVKNFKALKKAGVNRLSIGLQSLNNNSLKFLGRNHSAQDGLNALEIAKQCFKRISFDLIYGLPNQNEKTWEKELKEAINLAGEHISAYQLTIEKGTPFYASYRDGKFSIPEEEVLLNLYNMTDDLLKSANLEKYEVSNYAIKGAECVHNLGIWQGREYCGIGPGAHGRIILNKQWYATQKFSAPTVWLNKIFEKKTTFYEKTEISNKTRVKEILLTGLRIRKGVNIEKLFDNLNIQKDDSIINKKECGNLNKLGLIENNNDILRITKKGIPVLNHILNKIIL